MAKKIILAILILILILSIFAVFLSSDNSVDLFINGDSVKVETHCLDSSIDIDRLNDEICDYTLNVMNDTNSNITTLKSGIKDICNRYGMENPKINIDSIIGKDQIPVIVNVDGTSMVPTLQDGQKVLLNRTSMSEILSLLIRMNTEASSKGSVTLKETMSIWKATTRK